MKALSHELSRLGWKVWIDEDKLFLGCNIDAKMASGIAGADAVCLCITRAYIEKINAQDNNCAKEWNLAKAIGKKLLPIVLEAEMLDVRSWPFGVLTMYMANTFYVDCTDDDVRANAAKLSKMLEVLGRLRSSLSWPIFRARARIARTSSGISKSRVRI